MPHHGQGHVLQRQLHVLANACATAVTLSRQKRRGHHLAGDQVPGRQHMVHGAIVALWPGDEGQAQLGVDGVVHRRTPMAVALQSDLDEVAATLLQGIKVQPSAGRKVGQQQARVRPRCADERHRQLAALSACQIQGDRALVLVQAAPKEAHALRRDGPALVVQATAQGVDADHVGAHLRQCQTAQRCCDKSRSLDHAHATEDWCDQCHFVNKADSSKPRAMTFKASVSSAPSKMESTRASTK